MALGQEATITVNGHTLTTAEAMTMRVALGSFAISLADGLGDDDTGKAICEGYKSAIARIHKMFTYRER